MCPLLITISPYDHSKLLDVPIISPLIIIINHHMMLRMVCFLVKGKWPEFMAMPGDGLCDLPRQSSRYEGETPISRVVGVWNLWYIYVECLYYIYCIVVYYIILYCIVLYYIVLYYIVLYCVILYCIILYYIILYCHIILYCIVLYYIVLYYIILYCIILYCIILYCSVLYYMIL